MHACYVCSQQMPTSTLEQPCLVRLVLELFETNTRGLVQPKLVISRKEEGEKPKEKNPNTAMFTPTGIIPSVVSVGYPVPARIYLYPPTCLVSSCSLPKSFQTNETYCLLLRPLRLRIAASSTNVMLWGSRVCVDTNAILHRSFTWFSGLKSPRKSFALL